MALVATRLATQADGDAYVEAIAESSDGLVSHFVIHNGLAGSLLVLLYDGAGNEVRRRSFPPGDHVFAVPPGRALHWKSGKLQDFSVGLSG